MDKSTQPGEAKFTKPASATSDGFSNLASGLGGSNDKSMYSVFKPTFSYANRHFYGWIYRDDWICQSIIDTPVDDASSKGRTIKSKMAEDFDFLEQQYNLLGLVADTVRWANLYGGAGILVITGQPLSEPLDYNRIKKGTQLDFIVYDNTDLVPFFDNTWNMLESNYMQPTHYLVSSGSAVIHPSHVIPVIGRKVPRSQAVSLSGWGISELHACLSDLTAMIEAKGGVQQMMSEANVDVFTSKNLWTNLSTNQEGNVLSRYQNMNVIKSTFNALLLDKDLEGYERKSLELGGASGMIEVFMTWISGAAKIPITKLFGTSAKGLNATGEGDLNNYYDRLRAMQKHKFDPILRQLDNIVCLAHFGRKPDDFDYKWNPLQESNALQLAQAEKLRSDKLLALLDAGVITRSQVAESLQQHEEVQFEEGQIDEMKEEEKIDLDKVDDNAEESEAILPKEQKDG